VRKLVHPLVNDDDLLAELGHSRSASAKAVAARRDDMEARYQVYRANQGNPWTVAVDATFLPLRPSLHHLYKSPPRALEFIESLRASVEGACPVCGRDSLGTLDHYLPKADYSEYSFFSLNLVPACNRCNNARNNLARGAHHGERPVHPYFDAFAERRLMSIRAEPDWRAPRLTPVPFDVGGDELVVVQWHIDNIVRPSGIDGYLANLWGRLVEKPHTFLGTTATHAAVRAKLAGQVEIEVATGQSLNGWRSCFYHGLMSDAAVLDYLVSLV
jgi:5-methylcytosine-specific restriction endonuclease McrA